MTPLNKFTVRGGVALALALLVSTSTLAQEGRSRADNSDDAPEDGAISQNIDEQTARILSEAIEFLNMDMFVEARARLADLRLDRLSPFERSRYEQLMFNLDINDENYPGARGHLQAAIDSGGLNVQEISTLKYQMAQLFVQEEKWAEAATALEAWIAAEPMPNSAAYYLLAAAYYQQDLLDKALPNAQKAVDLAETPQEAWLQMLASLLMNKEDFVAALPVVKRMVNMFPDKKGHWQLLSGIYLQQEDYENALVAVEFQNYAGMITTDAEIRNLADLYMVQDMPHRAALLLESAIEDGKIEKNLKAYEGLANAWAAAREYEKAIPVLGQAAELSNNGELYKRMGEVQQQLLLWKDSAESFENALEKGDLRDEAYTQYILGYSLFMADEFTEAKRWLERAARDSDQRRQANDLINVIDARMANQ